MMSHSTMDRYNVNENFHGRESNMLTVARTRLMKDLKTLQDDAPAGVSGAPEYDNIMKWTALIFGPNETEWEGGMFKLSLKFSESYPYKPPMVRFGCHMFHPNVDIAGSIWLDILGDLWNPCYDVSTILISVQSLLCDPDIDNPVNKEAAQMFRNNKHEYNERVRVVVELSLMDDEEKYFSLTSLSDRFKNRFCISDSLLKP